MRNAAVLQIFTTFQLHHAYVRKDTRLSPLFRTVRDGKLGGVWEQCYKMCSLMFFQLGTPSPHFPPSTKTDIDFTHVIRSLRNFTTLLMHTSSDWKLDTGTHKHIPSEYTDFPTWLKLAGHILVPQDLQDKTQHVTVMWQSCDHGLHGLFCRRVHFKDGR